MITQEDKNYAQARLDGCWQAHEILMSKSVKGKTPEIYYKLRNAAEYVYFEWRAWTQADPKLFVK